MPNAMRGNRGKRLGDPDRIGLMKVWLDIDEVLENLVRVARNHLRRGDIALQICACQPQLIGMVDHVIHRS